MMKSVFSIPDGGLSKLDTFVKLSTYERKLLQELCAILDRFKYSTVLIQRNLSPILTITVTLGLKHQMNQLPSVYINKMMTTQKSSLFTRLNPFENDNDFKISTTLDPRFKLRWCDENKVNTLAALLKNTVKSLHFEGKIDDTEGQEIQYPPAKKSKFDFFILMPGCSTPSKKRHQSEYTVFEVDLYLSEPCVDITFNILKF